MPRAIPAVRTMSPCDRCVHLESCLPFLRRIADAIEWERVHGGPRELPTVIVDCEGRFTPPSRHLPLKVT